MIFYLNLIIKKLSLPCFVKANRSGSSFGIFKVYDKKNLLPSIKKAFKYDTQLIIESNLNGLEVSVGSARYENEIQVFPSIMYSSTNGVRDFSVAAKLISQNIDIGKTIISHRFNLEDAEEAFQVADDKNSGSIKVVSNNQNSLVMLSQ